MFKRLTLLNFALNVRAQKQVNAVASARYNALANAVRQLAWPSAQQPKAFACGLALCFKLKSKLRAKPPKFDFCAPPAVLFVFKLIKFMSPILTEVVLLYILYQCAVYVGATDLLSLRVWVKELVALDRIANCNLLCSASLVFVPKQVCLRSRYSVGAATAGARCFVLPN